MTSKQLSQYDVVITTYQTVAGEAEVSASVVGDGPAKKKKKAERTLFGVKWKVSEVLHKHKAVYHFFISESFSMKDIPFVIRRPRWPKLSVSSLPSADGCCLALRS
jgi:hypothetical protein